jgi:thiamine biosynthesis lipoprotein
MSADKKASRRHFLAGELAGMFAEVLDAAAEQMAFPPQGHGPGKPADLVRVSRRAMAALFEVYFSASQYPHGTEKALSALELLEPLEATLSLFRADSQLNYVNANAAYEPVCPDAAVLDLIKLGLQVWRETAGAFDLTATPLWELWGFARRSARIPAGDEIQAALRYVGSQFVELDCQAQTVRFLKEGIRLSFASLGKGYALDRCAERLMALGVGDFLIHGGYSSVIARGSIAGNVTESAAAAEQSDNLQCRFGLPPDALRLANLPEADSAPCQSAGHCTAQAAESPEQTGGWVVGVKHPLRKGRRVAEIRLCDGALSTSGSGVQSLIYRGRRYGHIIDPRTGWPAQSLLSVTVVAPTAVLAEALSTAFFVLGLEQSAQYCAEHRDVGAVVVCPARRPGGVDVHVLGLSDQQVRLLV